MHEPITPGSNHIHVCKDDDGKKVITAVLAQDVRAGPRRDSHTGEVVEKLQLQQVKLNESRSLGAGCRRHAISTESKQEMLASLVQGSEAGASVAERVEQLQSTGDSSLAWACSHCTCINTTARVKCGMCAKNRPRGQA